MESYVKFIIACGTEGKKGINIRNVMDDKTIEYSVTVEPVFLNNAEVGKFFSTVIQSYNSQLRKLPEIIKILNLMNFFIIIAVLNK